MEGVFCYSSAPEHFQHQMNDILNGLPGVVCFHLWFKRGGTYRTWLQSISQRIQAAGVTLNKEKYEFRRTSIKFLGSFINSDGITGYPQKTAAIREMERPKSVPELRRYFGMVNHLHGKILPKHRGTHQTNERGSRKLTWLCGPNQDNAFQKIKSKLASPQVLAWYDPSRTTKILADASSYRIKVVLMLHTDGQWRPIAYASRSMTNMKTST